MLAYYQMELIHHLSLYLHAYVTLKFVALVAVPPGVVTVISPLVVPACTLAVMVVAFTRIKIAVMLLHFTEKTLVKLVPVMVITVYSAPLVGVNAVMVGGGITVKTPLLVAVPPGVVSTIFPLFAPAGTMAVMVVAFTTVNVAAAPLNCTAEAFAKFVPVSVMVAPPPPPIGVKEAIVGGTRTVKFVALVAVPPGVVTVIGPLLEPDCTLAVMLVELTSVKIAAVPLNFTLEAVLKFVPVMVTDIPGPALVGVNEVIVGGGTKVKAPPLVAVPPRVVRVTFPVDPLPTFAVSEVKLMTVNDAAVVPPNATLLTPLKLVPVMVTTISVGPLLGVNAVIVGGGGMTVKFVVLVAVPPGVITLIGPLVEPDCTLAVIVVAFTGVKIDAVPLNLTDDTLA